MISKINSSNLIGIQGFLVKVEVDITKGIPSFNIVGLASKEIKESRERVKSAIINTGYKFPNSRIVVNLSPADMKKEGSFLDLPIAIGIMRSLIKKSDEYLSESVFVGELSLDGTLRKVNGILPILISSKENNIKRVFIPEDNLLESKLIKNIDIVPIKNLNQCIEYLNGKIKIDIEYITKINTESINNIDIKKEDLNNQEDFSQVYGNSLAKRCAEISVAGNHNMLMIGSPGSGKTMIARRMKSILPDMEEDEIIEINKIYSSIGSISQDGYYLKDRPFRSPHHTITLKSLIGGGSDSKPGEVVLAHKGILFLDEIAEFEKKTLDTLRQPIEDKKVNISRLKCNIQYPSDVLLIGAMNPCPCGNFKSNKECSCKTFQIDRYKNKISGPLLDRFDLFVELNSIDYKQMQNLKPESSKTIKERINKARVIQKERFKDYNIKTNHEMKSNHIDKFCLLDKDCKSTLNLILDKYRISNRSYFNLIKVARTIADLDDELEVKQNHILEAFGYKKAYIKYFGER